MRRQDLLSRFQCLIIGLFAFTATLAHSRVVYEGTEGPGKGRHLVFLAGDHEYRSEESLPALARILAKHHGFKCTVLFNLDPATGEIVAGNSNMPGMEALASADLAVVFLRFQAFPAEQMRHFDDYLTRGGPVVGLRTATHAFHGNKDPFTQYNYNAKEPDYELGFGHQVLGQTWVGHYGRNHQQSTRISLVPTMADHPILRGVKDVWVQAGGYVGKPTDGDILTLAQPLNGMSPDSPADAARPPQPSEWTRNYRSASGAVGRVFTTLYGASEDITNEGYRRLVLNGIFWAVGLESAIKPDLNVAFVGPFKPNTFAGGAYARGIKPEMYAGFTSQIPANNYTRNPNPPARRGAGRRADAEEKEPAKSPSAPGASLSTGKPGQPVGEGVAQLAATTPETRARQQRPAASSETASKAAHALTAQPAAATTKRPQSVAPSTKGERIVLLGNGLAERDVYYSRIETELALRFPEHALIVRNMGRVGSTTPMNCSKSIR